MKKILLLITLLTFNFSNSQESWFPLGADDFNQPSFGSVNYSKISHDNNNVPYVAFSDVFNNDKITIRKYVNNKWITVGSLGFSDGIATFISIDFDSNNIPYIAYKDTDIKIKKFDGTSWINVGNASASTNFEFSFKIAGNNIPYIAFQNSLNNNKATVKKFNGVSWELVGIDGISVNQSNYISLALNNQNIPYIAYTDVSSIKKASVQKFNGTTWEYVGSQAFTLGEATYTSIKIDNNDIPYVLYRDGAASGKATLQKFLNNNWSVVGISGFTSDNVLDLSFTFKSNNNPVVIYKSDEAFKRASVYTFNNSTWSNVGNHYISDGQADYSSISIDTNNNIFIAYKDVENGNIIAVKKFINNSWVIIADEPFTKETSNIHTVTDSNNVIYVLHHELYKNIVTVKKYYQGQWIQVGDSPGGSYENACDIAIDSNDNLYVAVGYIVKKFDKSTNTWIALPKTGMPAVNATVYFNSIDINSSNELVLVWKENTNSLIIKKYNGTSWVNVSNNEFYTGNAYYPVLKIDKNIVPNIIYLAYINAFNDVAVMSHTNSGWRGVGGTAISGFPISNALVTDFSIDVFNNILYASFTDKANNNSKINVKKFNGTSWENVGNLDFISSSHNPYLKIKNSKPYVIYQNGFENKVSLIEFNGSNWNHIGNQSFSSGKGNYSSLEFINNVPVAVYSGDKGSFAKYYGTENVLSLSDFSKNSKFNTYIYPNPVLDKFKIKTDDIIINVKLYDIFGKEILNIKNSDSEIDISNLKKGIYFTKIQQLNSTKTIKLIKN